MSEPSPDDIISSTPCGPVQLQIAYSLEGERGTGNSRSIRMSSTFQLPSSTSQSPSSTPAYSRDSPAYSNYDEDDEDTLPYPTELPRSDFLNPDFDASTYLSTLRNRHQTLEDLRTDLRQRSQLLNRELLDLVNGNYEDFIALGEDLKGGEERVEGIRVGVLGFKREVDNVRAIVEERKREVEELLEARAKTRREVGVGQALLEFDAGLVELEEGLGIGGKDEVTVGENEDEHDEDEDEDEAHAVLMASTRRAQKHVRQYILLTRAIERTGTHHPFLLGLRGRMAEARSTILLDLASTLRQAKGVRSQDDVLSLLKLYSHMDEESQGVNVLRSAG